MTAPSGHDLILRARRGEAEDLAVTTDCRDMLSEILGNRLNNNATNEIFPDHRPQITNVLT